MIKSPVIAMLFMLVMAVGAQATESHFSVTNSLTSMPLAFTENQGQWDQRVAFRADAGGATMWFTPEGAYYQFTRRIESDDEQVDPVDPMPDPIDHEPTSIETMLIKAAFVGANPSPRMFGEGAMEYKCNYFIGNDPSRWRTDVPNYTAVVFEEVYAGIDLKYYGNGSEMEYDFIVSPGADPSQIAIQYEGVESVTTNDAGELVVTTPWGNVIERRPVVYQMCDGKRVLLDARYLLTDDNTFGFFPGEDYNPTLALVIDPVLTYSTYLGGSLSDYCRAVAVDLSGAAYVTGYTASTDFPTDNAYQETSGGMTDVVVAKLSDNGDSLRYSTYIGGITLEEGYDIAVDSTGAAFVTGWTFSPDFPVVGAYQGTLQGGYDAFITKLSPAGNSLIYSTYLGGSSSEYSSAIAIDPAGAAYVAGYTVSTDFPTENGYQETFQGGPCDVYVTKLSSAGNSLIYSTYLGGSDTDEGHDIAVDGNGSAYVVGSITSTDFPTVNWYQTNQDEFDGFVTKLSVDGNSLIYSTYLGGSYIDYARAVAVDTSGAAYVTGMTVSADFPTEGGYQTDQGSTDAFVTKLSAAGNSLVYGTYLGGSSSDQGGDICVDGSGSAFVTGSTSSTDFPIQSAYQTHQNGTDVFVTRLNTAGDSLIYSTYLGGDGGEFCHGIALDASGAAYVTGHTSSDDFPTENGYQQTFQGEAYDGFVAKFAFDWIGAVDYSAGSMPVSICAADFDKDGDKDLAVANYDDYKVSVLKNNGDATFGAPVSYVTGSGPADVAAADVDKDGDQDLVVALEACDSVSVLKNNGDGTFTAAGSYPVRDMPISLALADFDKDGDKDLAVANYSIDSITVFPNDGTGIFEILDKAAVGYGSGNGPRSIITADFNSDGYDDIATANEVSNDVSVLINDGKGTFSDAVAYDAGTSPSGVVAGDLDGDDDKDLAVANEDSDDASVLKNNSDATFDAAVGYGSGNGPRSIVTGDIDGDGDRDLVVANEDSDNVSILKNNGDATFDAAVGYGSGNGPRSVCLTDLDGDGDLDVATANAESDDVSILLNETDVVVTCCIFRGDVDHSGEFLPMDVVYFVNWLWNSGTEPPCLDEADADGNGTPGGMDVVYLVNYMWNNGPPPEPCP